MSLRIRLSRGGAKKRPFYRIVIAEGTSPRDGRFVEKVGTYNPMLPRDHDDRVVLKAERIQHWLSVGARPTDRMQKILAAAGLFEAYKLRDQPKKSAPGKKRTEREAEEAEKAAAASEKAESEKAAAAEKAESEKAAAAAAPAEEAPAEEAQAAEAPAEDAPADEAPADEAPADEAPAEDAPADEAPAEEKAGT